MAYNRNRATVPLYSRADDLLSTPVPFILEEQRPVSVPVQSRTSAALGDKQQPWSSQDLVRTENSGGHAQRMVRGHAAAHSQPATDTSVHRVADAAPQTAAACNGPTSYLEVVLEETYGTTSKFEDANLHSGCADELSPHATTLHSGVGTAPLHNATANLDAGDDAQALSYPTPEPANGSTSATTALVTAQLPKQRSPSTHVATAAAELPTRPATAAVDSAAAPPQRQLDPTAQQATVGATGPPTTAAAHNTCTHLPESTTAIVHTINSRLRLTGISNIGIPTSNSKSHVCTNANTTGTDNVAALDRAQNDASAGSTGGLHDSSEQEVTPADFIAAVQLLNATLDLYEGRVAECAALREVEVAHRRLQTKYSQLLSKLADEEQRADEHRAVTTRSSTERDSAEVKCRLLEVERNRYRADAAAEKKTTRCLQAQLRRAEHQKHQMRHQLTQSVDRSTKQQQQAREALENFRKLQHQSAQQGAGRRGTSGAQPGGLTDKLTVDMYIELQSQLDSAVGDRTQLRRENRTLFKRLEQATEELNRQRRVEALFEEAALPNTSASSNRHARSSVAGHSTDTTEGTASQQSANHALQTLLCEKTREVDNMQRTIRELRGELVARNPTAAAEYDVHYLRQSQPTGTAVRWPGTMDEAVGVRRLHGGEERRLQASAAVARSPMDTAVPPKAAGSKWTAGQAADNHIVQELCTLLRCGDASKLPEVVSDMLQSSNALASTSCGSTDLLMSGVKNAVELPATADFASALERVLDWKALLNLLPRYRDVRLQLAQLMTGTGIIDEQSYAVVANFLGSLLPVHLSESSKNNYGTGTLEADGVSSFRVFSKSAEVPNMNGVALGTQQDAVGQLGRLRSDMSTFVEKLRGTAEKWHSLQDGRLDGGADRAVLVTKVNASNTWDLLTCSWVALMCSGVVPMSNSRGAAGALTSNARLTCTRAEDSRHSTRNGPLSKSMGVIDASATGGLSVADLDDSCTDGNHVKTVKIASWDALVEINNAYLRVARILGVKPKQGSNSFKRPLSAVEKSSGQRTAILKFADGVLVKEPFSEPLASVVGWEEIIADACVERIHKLMKLADAKIACAQILSTLRKILVCGEASDIIPRLKELLRSVYQESSEIDLGGPHSSPLVLLGEDDWSTSNQQHGSGADVRRRPATARPAFDRRRSPSETRHQQKLNGRYSVDDTDPGIGGVGRSKGSGAAVGSRVIRSSSSERLKKRYFSGTVNLPQMLVGEDSAESPRFGGTM